MNDSVTDELRSKLEETLNETIQGDGLKHLKKQVQSFCDEIESDIEWRLKDALAPMLAGWVHDMTIRTIDAILQGNENEIRRYLHCEQRGYTGRSTDTYAERDIARQHPIIHGKLHENSCVALRRRIVDAHRDLITSERILDLEDQVKSLVAQVNKANAEREAMWERVRGLA